MMAQLVSLKWTLRRHLFRGIHTRTISRSPARDPSLKYKRLIVCCDGTFHDNPSKPSNVVRFTRALQTAQPLQGGDEIQQVVLYQPAGGTGAKGITQRSMFARLTRKLTFTENITDAYMFLAKNFEQGDEIFLFGSSRGAYRVRALAGLISRIGLLKKSSLREFIGIYNVYREKGSDLVGWKTYLNERPVPWDRHHDDVKIKVIGCWDAAGSWREQLGYNIRHNFHDTDLSPIVENAFHCLALNECSLLAPAMWHLPQETQPDPDAEAHPSSTILRQLWMVGVHADVSGGHTHSADNALAWMIDQCHGFLTFDQDYIRIAFNSPSAQCDNSKIRNKVGSFLRKYDPRHRTPGEYRVTKHRRLWHDTKEMMHPAVWETMVKYPGRELPGLQGFKRVPDPSADNLKKFKWVKVVPHGDSEKIIELPEYQIVEGSWSYNIQDRI